MSTSKIQPIVTETAAPNSLGSYRVFHRILDWITNGRLQLLNITDRINDIVHSHLRGMLMGQTLCLQVRNASIRLGTWPSIIFAEFDGPRSRSIAVQVSGV